MIIAAALALAALAFFLNVFYLNSAQERAYGDAELVEVFKVTKPIPKGLTGDQAIKQEYVVKDKIPQAYRPGSSLTDINDITTKVAINALSPGQVVVDGQFVDSRVHQVTFAQRVPAGQVAVSISVDQVRGVAGLLLPGDKVNVLVKTSDPTKDDDDPNKSAMSVLYQNVNILAIGTKPAPQAGDSGSTKEAEAAAAQPTDTGLITLAVPLEAAQRIACVQACSDNSQMSFYLALVPPDNKPLDAQPAAVTPGNLLNGLSATPYPAA